VPALLAFTRHKLFTVINFRRHQTLQKAYVHARRLLARGHHKVLVSGTVEREKVSSPRLATLRSAGTVGTRARSHTHSSHNIITRPSIARRKSRLPLQQGVLINGSPNSPNSPNPPKFSTCLQGFAAKVTNWKQDTDA
jgi:hypothetical protein